MVTFTRSSSAYPYAGKWSNHITAGIKIFLTLFLMSAFVLLETVSAQTPPTFPTCTKNGQPDLPHCTSQDLQIAGAFLTGTQCGCTTGAQTTATLNLTIINKTQSDRTSIAFFANVVAKNPDGSAGSTQYKTACIPTPPDATTPGIKGGETRTFATVPITYTCGQTLQLTDVYLAWTDASGGDTRQCPLDFCSIDPKCGRPPANIDIIPLLTATASAPATVCTGSTTTLTVTASGGKAPYTYSINGGPYQNGNTFTVGAGTYTVSVKDAATPTPCTTTTNSVTITTQAPPNAGSNGTLRICAGTTVTAAQLFAALGGTPDAGGSWSPTLDGAGTYTYTVAATAPCTGSATATVTVTAQAPPNAGSNGTLRICAGTTVTAAQLFAALGGTPTAGGSWSPTLDGAGTYTYTVAATAPCTGSATATVTVTAQAPPNAGSNGTLTICAGTTVTAAQLFAALGGTPNAGGSWSPTLAGAGTYTYTVAATAPCTGTATATVTVTEQTTPNAGTNGTLRICAGTTVTAAQLFAALGGTPTAGGSWSPTLDGAGTYTYTVTATPPCTGTATATVTVTAQAAPNAGSNGTLRICAGTTVTAAQLFTALGGTPNAGGSWSPTLDGAGTYTYTVAATAPCTGSATATVTVTAQAPPNAGSNGTLNICPGTTVTAAQLFAALGGTPDAGGSWSPTLDGVGTYTYTVAATAPCTGSATATVTVTAQAAPNAGSNGTLRICAGTTVTAAQLFAALGGTPTAGGSWSPTLAGAGTYTYTVTATAPCTGSATATVTVTEQARPNAGTNGTLTICAGTTVTAAQLFAALGGTPTAGGSWSPTFAGAGTYTYTVAATAPCTGSATATVTVTAQSCTASYCTYTQGYWGNKNGLMKLPTLLMTPLVIGAPGFTTITITSGGAVALNNMMPGGGTPSALSSGSCSITTMKAPGTCGLYVTKQGRFDNVLLSQTITLALNTRVTPTLLNLAIQSGYITTSDGGCRSLPASVVNYLTQTGKATVGGLLELANAVLGGSKTAGVGGVPSLSDINDAVTTINEVFDECKTFTGYQTSCPSNTFITSVTTGEVSNAVTIPSKLSVNAFPNPFTSKVRFVIQSPVSGQGSLDVFNSLGQKVSNVYRGHIVAGVNQTVDFTVPPTFSSNLIYVLNVQGLRVSGKIQKE